MDTKEVLATYCSLMQDINLRTALMLDLGTNRHGLPTFCVEETHQLQVRMICETLAVACLLVHGDIEGARSARLTSAYKADFIMNALEKLHPRFYPRPTRQILRDGKPFKIEDIKDGFLTKDELIKSYRDTADFLHFGGLSDILANKQTVADGAAVGAWLRKLMMLLNHHVIFLAAPPVAGRPTAGQFKFKDGELAPEYQIIVQMAVAPHDNPEASVFQIVGQMPE